ncbi:hypothetical protein UFOVP188_28 [uncultured Caudovirales phage]|uniref:Uncharacterized protein n=1 Tax=uncultured Caudovirales phage TaxID=2100421 RepID=A0A6J7WFT5_9CAUD|nr:hypothetical protein UFOVP188_28 [uncultured Caudovirales phage]
MISRTILLAAAIGWSGSKFLPPDPPKPLTSQEIRDKGRKKSISNLCAKKKKSKTVKDLCEQWQQ